MKKKLFSRGLYVEGLRQLRLTGIIFLAALLLVGLSVPVLCYIDYLDFLSYAEEGQIYSLTVVSFLGICPLVIGIALVAAPVFTFILFGTFHKRSSSDFYHSLPYTRICMYLSFVAAIFTWLLGLTVIYCGATIATYLLMPQIFIVTLTGMWDIMLSMLALSMLLVFGIICAMSITGNPIANVTCAGLILFLPRLLITLVTFVLGDIAPIIDGHFGIFGMGYNALMSLISSVFIYGNGLSFTDDIPGDIYSIVLGLVYAVIGAVLFCKRKSETAGHPAPGKITHHAIRICVGLVVSSIVTCALLSGLEAQFAVLFYIVAALVYFAYELITQKTFRTIPKTFPGLAVLVALNIGIVAVCMGSAAVIHSYTPASNEVSAIYLESTYNSYGYSSQMDFNEYASQKAGRIRIEDEKAIAIATESLGENVKRSKENVFYPYRYWSSDSEVTYVELCISYVSDSEIKRTRNVYMTSDEYSEMMGYIQSNDDYKEVFFEIPDAIRRTVEFWDHSYYEIIDIDADDALEVLDCFRKEVQKMDFAQWMTYISSYGGSQEYGFEMIYQPEGENFEIRINFDPIDFPETTALLAEKANKNAGDYIDKLYDILSDIKGAEEKYEHMYMVMCAVGEDDYWRFSHYYYAEDYSSHADDTLTDDLNRLGNSMKNGEMKGNKYVLVFLNYEEDSNEDYSSKSATFFMPYPEDFEPESVDFELADFNNEDEATAVIYK